jgi:zinc protease
MKMSRRYQALWLITVLLLAAASIAMSQNAPAPAAKDAAQAKKSAPAAAVPAAKGPRPDQFKYPPLNFKIPKPADYRTTLSNGMVVYIAEDHDIPWFNASLIVKTGPFLEPREKIGLDAFTSSVMRSGGSNSMSGEKITERMDFLGGSLGSGGGFVGRGGRGGFGGVGGDAKSLSIHMRHIDEGLKIWLDVLSDPAFPEDKLRREKEISIPAIRNRNRDISNVSSRIYEQLVYGKESPIAVERTESGINSITRDELVAWYKKHWGASNAILVVSGDFKKAEILQKLDASFGKWRAAEKAVIAAPEVRQSAKAGIYMARPEGATPNQGIIRIGHLGLKTDDPDYPAVDLMNYILGGGSFSSRITKIVRTDMGLAYTANSTFAGGAGGRGGFGGGSGAGILYPGTFTAFCQTKNATVVFAAQLMLDIIEGMRSGNISDADLKMAKDARVEAFPSIFQGIGSTLQIFAGLEANGRPMDYYEKYLEKYRKVTLDDLKRAAQKWLKPDQMIILVCGNIDECKAGADKLQPNQPTIESMASKFGGRTMDDLARKLGWGPITLVPLN